jgi:N-acetylmuramic acid 6-phosphate etherase
MDNFTRITESDSLYKHLDKMSVQEILQAMNEEDAKVPQAVAACILQIEALIKAIVEKMKAGGRLFYIGAGTSGRLGIVDASECPPTFGIEHGRVIGLIAGGDTAIRKAVEFAEDDTEQAWRDLQQYDVSPTDVIIGIAASGTTPYVMGAVKICREKGILTGCITCNPGSPLAKAVDYPVEVNTGPEFVTGSTRLKSGTAQKLVLNMISTAAMIQLGRVKGNKMVDMQLSNNKLIDRGTKMVMEALNIEEEKAAALLKQYGSVREVLKHY